MVITVSGGLETLFGRGQGVMLGLALLVLGKRRAHYSCSPHLRITFASVV